MSATPTSPTSSTTGCRRDWRTGSRIPARDQRTPGFLRPATGISSRRKASASRRARRGPSQGPGQDRHRRVHRRARRDRGDGTGRTGEGGGATERQPAPGSGQAPLLFRLVIRHAIQPRPSVPIAEYTAQIANETPKRHVSLSCAYGVQLPDNVCCMFDAAEIWNSSGFLNRPRKPLLVAVACALHVRCITPCAEDCLESCTVQKQPAFDMRVRNGLHNGACDAVRGDLAVAMAKARAIRIGRYNDDIGSGATLPLQIVQKSPELPDEPWSASGCIAPVKLDINASFLRKSKNECVDDCPMGIILSEKSFYASKSPRIMRTETGSGSSCSDNTSSMLERLERGPHPESGSTQVQPFLRRTA